MSKITTIATGLPQYKYPQSTLFSFADKVYCKDEQDSRKLKFLYHQSGIDYRYSILPDFDTTNQLTNLFSHTNQGKPEADVGSRMQLYNLHAPALSVSTIMECIAGKLLASQITHLITVSCTGMSAPGLDLQIMEQLNLPNTIARTSVNFMGCYAAIHALKIADAICNNDTKANVVIVCTEFCTLHFQTEPTTDNLTSSLLFADGCAAVLVQHDAAGVGIKLANFYSQVNSAGKNEMSWSIAATGFLMTLSGYIPELIKADFEQLVANALAKTNQTKADITQWCIHPGGKKIVDAIASSLQIDKNEFSHAYQVLQECGNMSSPTILFVLKKILNAVQQKANPAEVIFGAAFGPGLTMETFTATYG